MYPNDVLSPPADFSKASLEGWFAAIRFAALDYPPNSPQRQRFLDEAARKVNYAAFLGRKKRGAVAMLKEQAARLPGLLSTHGH